MSHLAFPLTSSFLFSGPAAALAVTRHVSAWAALFANQDIWIPATAWAIAQVLKVIIVLITRRKLKLTYLVSAGGMPSSHSALVMGLTTAIALDSRYGMGSGLFALALIMASIVMYDAAGVRHAVSIQARLLNRMIEELFAGHEIQEQKVRELIGHTPIQVVAGAIVGVAVTLALWYS